MLAHTHSLIRGLSSSNEAVTALCLPMLAHTHSLIRGLSSSNEAVTALCLPYDGLTVTEFVLESPGCLPY